MCVCVCVLFWLYMYYGITVYDCHLLSLSHTLHMYRLSNTSLTPNMHECTLKHNRVNEWVYWYHTHNNLTYPHKGINVHGQEVQYAHVLCIEYNYYKRSNDYIAYSCVINLSYSGVHAGRLITLLEVNQCKCTYNVYYTSLVGNKNSDDYSPFSRK